MRLDSQPYSPVLALLCLLASTGCGQKTSNPAGAAGKTKLEFPVEVAPVVLRSLSYVVTAPGTITAFEQVQVTARVGGAVDKVMFSEGQSVQAGQVLAVIEVQRYQLAVEQAKASVDKAQAGEAQAEDELNRRQGANAAHPGLITGEDLATFTTQVRTGKADVSAAQQALKVAALNLHDAYVRAPIAGVIQTRSVETGQYLQPGSVLATLLQRDPLLLKFQVTEQDAPRIQPGMIATMTLRESSRTYSAKVTLVAGSADSQSHLVPVTAEVDDKEHKYWLRPGAFCDVTIPIGATRQAVIVPEMSIRASERGMISYVVEGSTAKERVLTIGMHTPDGNVEVMKGLSAGEMLVVRGAEPLNDGSPVKIAQRTTLDEFDAGTHDAAAAPSSVPSAPAASPGESGASPSASAASSSATRTSTHAPSPVPSGGQP